MEKNINTTIKVLIVIAIFSVGVMSILSVKLTEKRIDVLVDLILKIQAEQDFQRQFMTNNFHSEMYEFTETYKVNNTPAQ